jgi:TPR repeat protein
MKKIANRISLTVLSIMLFCLEPQSAQAKQSTADHYRFHPKSALAKRLHKKMVAGRSLKLSEFRLLADQGDRLAAYRFAILLEYIPSIRAEDTVHYYGIAVALGQKSAIAPLAGILRLHYKEISAPRLRGAEAALRQIASSGNTEAMRALASLYSAGAPFGLRPNEAIAQLRSAAKFGDPDAAYEIGVVLSTGIHSERELKEARMNLDISAKSGNPIARSLASEMEKGQ